MGATPANPPVKTEPPWDSPQTRTQFMRSCGDCHSNETVWPWYSRVPPASILVARDVREGRQKLNASEWDTRPQDTRELSEVMQQGEMPPAMYVVIHPDAVLSNADRQALLKGLTATFGVGHGGR
ncbi:MAG: heme-binding domain-containing protein [Chloroflexi bacterium]|nr:heme-binding domain-containing protein [Chloroflexota bacterium]